MNRNWRSTLVGLLTLLALAIAGAAANAAQFGEPIGKVDEIAGRVVAERGTDSVRLNVDDAVLLGDVLVSGPAGAIRIQFLDDSSFAMGRDARMTLDEMIYEPNGGSNTMLVGAARGVFTFVSGKVAKSGEDAMQIDTPVVTLGIRGTSGVINSSSEGVQVIRRSGTIRVSNAAGGFNLTRPNEGAVFQSREQAGTRQTFTETQVQEIVQTNIQDIAPPLAPAESGPGDGGTGDDADGSEADGDAGDEAESDDDGEEDGAEDDAEGEDGEDATDAGETDGQDVADGDPAGDGENTAATGPTEIQQSADGSVLVVLPGGAVEVLQPGEADVLSKALDDLDRVPANAAIANAAAGGQNNAGGQQPEESQEVSTEVEYGTSQPDIDISLGNELTFAGNAADAGGGEVTTGGPGAANTGGPNLFAGQGPEEGGEDDVGLPGLEDLVTDTVSDLTDDVVSSAIE